MTTVRELLKAAFAGTGVFHPLRGVVRKRRQPREVARWEQAGRPVPVPHVIKQKVLREYGRRFMLDTLVETGTYQGDMVDALRHDFSTIYSVELNYALFAAATERFRHDPHVHIVQGDSGTALGNVLGELRGPALFWLDGHYSAGITALGSKVTPIFEELDQIFLTGSEDHVVIIDDARLFGTDPGYPSLQALVEHVLARRPGADIQVDLDSIRLTAIR